MNQITLDKTLVHIVPGLRPRMDGAGEYALNLALELRQAHGINSQFIVCDPERDDSGWVEGFAVQRLRVKNEACIWSMLPLAKNQFPAVLLHYCAYGYNRQGFPLWLHQGIQSWLDEGGGAASGSKRQFSTIFYETLGTSVKPWQKEFCLRIPQKWLIQEIHRRSQLSVTGCPLMQAFLNGVAPGKTLRLPVRNQPTNELEQALDWKNLAAQYHERLFQAPTASNTGLRLRGELQGALPAFVPAQQAVRSSVSIRPRPA